MEIPGITVLHAVITDACRDLHGDEGALAMVFNRIRKEYSDTRKNRSKEVGLNFHVVLTVEKEEEEKNGC